MHEEFNDLAALEAIGGATEDEARRLEEHCADCDACNDALAEYQQAASGFAIALDPVQPRRDARDTLLRQIQTDAVAESIVAEVSENVEAASRRRIPSWWFAAAAVFFLALFGWSELRLRALREEIHVLQREKEEIAALHMRLSGEMQMVQERLDTVRSASQVFRLAGTADTSRASASVFMDGTQRRAVVIFTNLEKNDASHSYQLWIIRGDSQPPMSAGVFDADDAGRAELQVKDMPVDVPIAGLAVTLEPRGGLPSPSGTILMQGKA